MTIILYDAREISCNTIDFSTDGKSIITDGCSIIPMIEVLRIIKA